MSRKVRSRHPGTRGRARRAGEVECQRWTFVADTDCYAGSFERELGEYVTGIANSYRSCEGLVALARRELGVDEASAEVTGPFAGLFEKRVNESGADVVTLELVTILPTPGWETRRGEHHRVGVGRPCLAPAFLSVGLFLTRRPSPGQLVLLVERASRFGRVCKRHGLGAEPKVTGCRLMRETVHVDSWAVRVVGRQGQRRARLRRIAEAEECMGPNCTGAGYV